MATTNYLKTFILTILLLISILFTTLTYRAYIIFKPCQHNLTNLTDHARIKLTPQMLTRLQTALQYPTVSFKKGSENMTAKNEFIQFIRKEYQDIEEHSFVNFELVNNYSMLYEIKGRNSNLKPYLVAAHFDVVPAEPELWEFEPFSATISEGFINARGTMDNKASMLGQLEAIRIFLAHGGQPERTIYLAYGHDEEISGRNGAQKIANLLALKTGELEFVLDEGTMVIEDIFPALQRPSALIGIAEKGYLTVKFSVNVTGGHSSMPNNEANAIYILAEAVARLKAYRPRAILRQGPARIMLESLAVNLGFVQRILLTNIWLFAPLIEMIFTKTPTLDSLQRTTSAVTIFNAGVKDNVLPAYAEFVINHRIHNLQSCGEMVDFDIKTIGDDRIKHEVLECFEPSHVSPMDTLGFEVLEHVTMAIYPDTIIQPSVCPGQTDSRFYNQLTKNIYKYFPIRIKNADLKRYHGVDERISIENYENVVNFFCLLFKNTDAFHVDKPRMVKNEL